MGEIHALLAAFAQEMGDLVATVSEGHRTDRRGVPWRNLERRWMCFTQSLSARVAEGAVREIRCRAPWTRDLRPQGRPTAAAERRIFGVITITRGTVHAPSPISPRTRPGAHRTGVSSARGPS